MSGDWGYGAVFKIFLWGYLVGGLTLLPAVLVAAWFLGTRATEQDSHNINTAGDGATSEQRRKSDTSANGKNEDNVQVGVGIDDEILEKLKGRTHEPDACAGYFAVCREYVPGGVNGKPPDRTTPAGAVVAVESPSVYQSMYRSIFDRNKNASPTIEASNAKNKKARNVFYVVLRYVHTSQVHEFELISDQSRPPHAVRQRRSARSTPRYIARTLQSRHIWGWRTHTGGRALDQEELYAKIQAPVMLS